jgi:hypothetical protein
VEGLYNSNYRSHHLDEEQDPADPRFSEKSDPDSHKRENLDPDPH